MSPAGDIGRAGAGAGPVGRDANGRIIAVLGPTNTGKTHLAIERMLGFGEGMIGLPLRLLAREVYDRVVAQKGARAVALITGEERIAPESARYFVCTVEAMPLERRVDFLAVDEVQLARDPDRGHIFTDRLLRARGLAETMFLGSDTMRTMIRRLVPTAVIERRERLSLLSYVGPRKLTKLTKRTAIVAFSAEEVYAIAELMRRQRGGAAVVMGALSPRTRNAQVALYQNGDVDFLVATDAIGMGLNMDVDHVAFAAYAKFDGRRTRVLRPDEVAQIAGRAGRFRDDGTFGETGACPPFDEETVQRVMGHSFETIEAVEWRNANLDFTSVATLLRSLETPPDQPGLMRSGGALDEESLRRLAREDDILDRITRPSDVRRLWDLCVMPDFRKSTIDEHARLLQSFGEHLLGARQRIPQDVIAKALERLDRRDGDLDALQARLAHVRTWTYAANRPDWLDDCELWRGQTRALEDKLSDALHDQLTQRFIDRRTSALVRRLARDDLLEATVEASGDVSVEGHHVGRLEGLVFKPDPKAMGREGQAVRLAASRALRPEVVRRLAAIAACTDKELRLGGDGVVRASLGAVARVCSGGSVLAPRLALLASDDMPAEWTRKALARVGAWLRQVVDRTLAPMVALQQGIDSGALNGPARGIAFALIEHGGVLARRDADANIAALTQRDRTALAGAGVRLGRACVYLPGLMSPAAARVHAVLLHAVLGLEGRPFLPAKGFGSGPASDAIPDRVAAAVGLFRVAGWFVRADLLERFLHLCHRTAAADPDRGFVITERLVKVTGLSTDAAAVVLSGLGYRRKARPSHANDAPAVWRSPSLEPRQERQKPHAPFAVLADMMPLPARTPKRRRAPR